MRMAPEDIARVEQALHAAQGGITARIECVLAETSSNYEILPIIVSALLALAAPWPLLLFSEWSAERVYVAQLAVFLIALALLSLPAVRVLLIPRRARNASAHRAALDQFVIRGVSHGTERNGVLIYVSLAERYARIVADEAAARVIHQTRWQAVVDKLLSELRGGPVAPALIGAVDGCAKLLAKDFPGRGDSTRPPGGHFHIH
jgi:putative membrane protein